MIVRKLARAACLGGISLGALAGSVHAQDITSPNSVPAEDKDAIVVTGSRLKIDPNNSALPIQIIRMNDLEREGINSAEQAVMYLASNGSGADNLASNADVISTAAANRGAAGASFANLRGQGAASTLVLLNGRRIAAHGLSGAAVDVNQIPFAALDRIEVLKDGASAIYGTDAVGGVINYITRTNYNGIGVQGSVDATEQGGGNIYRVSGIAGWGDLADNGINVMAAVGYNWTKPLRGDQRDFVNLFQYDRALAPETRGTPFATIVALTGTIIPSSAGAPFMPGSTTQRVDAINVLNLPGGESCGVVEGQGAYDWQAWNIPNYRYSCAFDSARSAYLQQAQETLTYLGRAVAKLGEHQISFEVTGSDAEARKVYSEIQLTPNTSTQNYAYRRIPGVNTATYDAIYDRLIAMFPTLGARGTPLGYRWRCLECGPREVETKTKTFRAGAFIDGPVTESWDYHAGASYADSRSNSVLGGGYYYTSQLIAALNTGIINPFLFPGQTQSQAALDLLASASARGEEVYRGKYSVFQADAGVAGKLFALPGGESQLAVGVDYRREKYTFNGNLTSVYAAPTDNANNISGATREVKSAYAEMSFPVLPEFELTAAVRYDDYSNFGSTTNPKFTAKFRPVDGILLRASYNTAFRVPSFNQLFNGRTSAPYTGTALVDPSTCPSLVPTTSGPCARVSPAQQITGGNPDLRPETARLANIGVVFQPTNRISLSADWWMINRKDTIQIFTLSELMRYYSSLSDRFERNAAGTITGFDLTWANAGESKTQGIDVSLRMAWDALGGTLSAGMDGTYLMQKKDRVVDSVAFLDKIGTTMPGGLFSPSGDLGLRWKHNAFVTWSNDDWSVSFSQIFRDGYNNRVLAGVTAGVAVRSDVVYSVKPYAIYNTSVSYSGIGNVKLTAGIKNLFDTDPPFAISYDDNTGGGSSWEPRVADPRGRSFVLQVEAKI